MVLRAGLGSVVLFAAWSLAGAASAAVIPAASCSSADVQAAVDAAASGDTVVVSGGPCSWAGGTVTIPNAKGITLSGGGTTTIAGSSHISIYSNSVVPARVTGFTFTGSWPCCNNFAVSADGTPSSAPYRIDHMIITGDPAVGGQTLIQAFGNGPGLIDHNQLNAPANSEIIHNVGLGPSDDSGWLDDVVPGGPEAVYIEDNAITNNDVGGNPAYFWGNSAIQSYYGARTVFRHNALFMSQVDQHGTGGMIGARWWEIYENTFSTDFPNASQCCFITLRAGSGVVFNNHHVGANLNGDAIDLYEEDTGYPALYQIGRGRHQALDPAYVWGNDAFFSVGSQTPAMVQAGRDYHLSAKPGYVPYSYPHPLQSTGGPLAVTPTAEPSAPDSRVRVFPNPWRIDRHAGAPVRFTHLPAGGDVRIFSVSGRLIANVPAVNGAADWRVNGRQGIFLYLVTSPAGEKQSGKIVILR